MTERNRHCREKLPQRTAPWRLQVGQARKHLRSIETCQYHERRRIESHGIQLPRLAGWRHEHSVRYHRHVIGSDNLRDCAPGTGLGRFILIGYRLLDHRLVRLRLKDGRERTGRACQADNRRDVGDEIFFGHLARDWPADHTSQKYRRSQACDYSRRDTVVCCRTVLTQPASFASNAMLLNASSFRTAQQATLFEVPIRLGGTL